MASCQVKFDKAWWQSVAAYTNLIKRTIICCRLPPTSKPNTATALAAVDSCCSCLLILLLMMRQITRVIWNSITWARAYSERLPFASKTFIVKHFRHKGLSCSFCAQLEFRQILFTSEIFALWDVRMHEFRLVCCVQAICFIPRLHDEASSTS